MKSFFKSFFASLLATLLVFLIFFLIISGIIGRFASKFDKEDTADIKENSVLVLDLNYNVPDKSIGSPESWFGIPDFGGDKVLGLNDILHVIHSAKEDENIQGIYFKMGIGKPGYAIVEEVRDALIDFKKSGKFIVSYGESANMRNLYLATIGDGIYVNPGAYLDLLGMYAKVIFYKGLLEKLDVDMEIYFAGKFKGATEPFRLKQLSEENRHQIRSVVNSLYDHMLNAIGGDINLAPELLDSLIDTGKLIMPAEAIKNKLINGLAYEDEVKDMIKERLKLNSEERDGNTGKEDKEELRLVKAADYLVKIDDDVDKSDSDNKLAVVYASGEIIDGSETHAGIGSAGFAKLLAKLRKDDKVKAVVLRINSPGGSSLASEVIWREVVLLKEKKPLVVSMGNVAASGGYFIACPANMIIAQPNTITGSIGVFFMVPEFGDLLENKLGISIDTVKTGPHADMISLLRNFTSEEGALVQKGVDDTYQDFLQKVAAGRNMDIDKVHEIAQGRIWTGLQAIENGLVDKLGGIEIAINEAASLANIDDYEIAEYPKEQSLFDLIFGNGDKETLAIIEKEGWMEWYSWYLQLKSLKKSTGMKMMMPYILELN